MPDGRTKVKTKRDQMDQKIQPVALTADQAHAMLGGNAVISRASFYAGIHRGEIPAKRIGRRLIIPRYAFERWLEEAGITRPAGAQQPQAEAQAR